MSKKLVQISNFYYPLSNKKAASETSFWCNLGGFCIATLFLLIFYLAGCKNFLFLLFVNVFLITFFITCLECLFFKKNSLISRLKIYRKINWKRVFYKEVTFLTTLAVIAFIYWLLPLYNTKLFHDYFAFLRYFVPFIIICSIPYLALMDKIDIEPDDIYYRLGYAITHLKKGVSRFELANYARGWLVKLFWLPLMIPSSLNYLRWGAAVFLNIPKASAVELVLATADFCYFIDLAFAAVGYLVNLKFLNSHTRTAEPTFYGWASALSCYWPFWDVLLYNYFFNYGHVFYQDIFTSRGVFFWIWFVIIVLCQLIYACATVAGGIRVSNLTYRGLWNTGPFKYTKHPAYVFKNLSWWFISMPFMAPSWSEAVRYSLFLLGNNFLYYLRARTEERHLSHYPEYVEYALMMNEKSIFRWVAKIFPFLKFKPIPKKDFLFEAKDYTVNTAGADKRK